MPPRRPIQAARPPRWPRAAGSARFALAAIVTFAGCAAPVPERSARPAFADRSEAAASVLYASAAEPGPEADRLDARLNLRSSGPVLASQQWPETPRPDIERERHITIPRNPDSVLIFLPPYRRDGY